MAAYRVVFTPAAERALRKLPKEARRGINLTVAALAQNPRPGGVVKMANSDQWRVRWRTYRVVYEVHDKTLCIQIVRLGHRREVYDR